MTYCSFFRLVVFVSAISMLFAAGCASTEASRFYTLSTLAQSETNTIIEKTGQGVSIGVGPVKFPDYLYGPKIATRTSQNAIEYGEFDRWAGSLEEDFVQTLAENLSILLSTDRVSIYPWPRPVPIDYQVEIQVLQFDGKSGGKASLIARWNIFRGDAEKSLLVMKKSNFIQSVDIGGYEAMAAAQSRTLLDLSREIAAAVRKASLQAP